MSAKDHLDEMMSLRKSGWTLQEIGDRFGVTRERVRQLVGPGHHLEVEAARRAQRQAELARLKPEVHRAMLSGEPTPSIRERYGLSKSEYSRLIDPDDLAGRVRLSQAHRRIAHPHDPLPDLQRAAQILGRTPGMKAYERLRLAGQLPAGAVSAQSVAVLYGAWSIACEEAGLVPHPRHANPRFGGQHYTDAEILGALRQWKKEHGKWPTVEGWDGRPTYAAIRMRFGSWMAAIQEAAALDEEAA